MVSPLKTCTKCNTAKEHTEFSPHPHTRDKHRPECKACRSSLERGWRKANPERTSKGRWTRAIRSSFGLSPDQYESLKAKQNDQCAICGAHQSTLSCRLAVDHCHSTGLLRGLLCRKCNLAIGKFNDNPVLLLKAAHYLMATTTPAVPQFAVEFLKAVMETTS